MDNRYFPLVVHVTYGPHAGVQTDIVVQEEYLVFRERDSRAIVPIQWVLIGHNRIHVVVPTRELEDDQHRRFRSRSHHSLLSLSILGILEFSHGGDQLQHFPNPCTGSAGLLLDSPAQDTSFVGMRYQVLAHLWLHLQR